MSDSPIIARLPAAALSAGMIALFLAIPYASFTSDVANFGQMGNDILRLGYLPTLAYGQSYLFSMTPYSYALVRWLAPEWVSDISALKIAGAIFSISGVFLIMESLRLTQKFTGKPQAAPLALFALMIASSDAYLFDLSLNSSNEISIFLLGLLMFCAVRIESALAEGKTPSRLDWLLLGTACGLMAISRPMLLAFALPALLLLSFKESIRAGWSAAPRLLAPLSAGIFIGYLPMLAHSVFRAQSWPYKWSLPLDLFGGAGVENAVGVLIHVILPRLMTMLWGEFPFRYIVTALWILAVLALLISALRHDGWKALTIADKTWIIGQSLSILIMAVIPSLSGDVGARRYCLHLLPAITWIFCRFAFPAGITAATALILSVLLAASSVAGWKDRLAHEWTRNGQIIETQRLAVQELAALDAVIFTDYWDAYLLNFVSREKITAEAFPWQIVRRYGYFTEERARSRTVWLVCDGYATTTLHQLAWELGEDATKRMKRRDTQNRVVGRLCEIWELPEPDMAPSLMKKYHPDFFAVPYPPR